MSLAALALPLDVEPMEAKLVDSLPEGTGWQFEPKWDGFRCLAFRSDDSVELRAKSGKSLTRYFPEVVAMLRKAPAAQFVVDGELAIPRDGRLAFDDLQLRLHPAESRIRKLAAATPAVMILFDCLLTAPGRSLAGETLAVRRDALERFVKRAKRVPEIILTPRTLDREDASRWLSQAGGSLDGVVAKRLDGPYRFGERAMLKVKRLRTADCVVGGFRYEAGTRLVGSLLLGLYNAEGKLDHVGFTSSFGALDRAELTRKLERLVAPPGFTGNAPGGPSRWNTERSAEWEPLRTRLVVEVRYDHVTGGRFRHGTRLLRWRPDKAPRQCTFDQIREEAAPAELSTRIAATSLA